MTPTSITIRLRTWDAETVNGVLALAGTTLHTMIPQSQVMEILVPENQVDEVIARVNAHPGVVLAHRTGTGRRMYVRDMPTGIPTNNGKPSGFMRYPFIQSHMHTMNVIRAWRHTRGACSVPLAVLDDGINTNLAQYAGKTIYQWDSALNVANSYGQGSGTHGSMVTSCAVSIGGVGRMYGTAPDASLMAIKTTSSGGVLLATAMAAGIIYAVDHGAKILTSSIGYYDNEDPTFVLRDAVNYAWDNGAITSWAAGNFASDVLPYPQHKHNTTKLNAVGGIHNTHEPFGLAWDWQFMSAYGTMYGPYVDMAANFAALVLTTGGTQTYNGGTSFSAPMVAGIMQLVLSINPLLTGQAVLQIVKATMIKSCPVEQWMWDNHFPVSSGIPDAEAAVIKAKATVAANAGVMFPYMRIHSTVPRRTTGDWDGAPDPQIGVTDEFVNDGITRHVNGPIGFQLEGFCSTGDANYVELWINDVLEYAGPPKSTWLGLFQKDERRNRLWSLRVLARNAVGHQATQEYITQAPQVGSVQSVAFSTGPPQGTSNRSAIVVANAKATTLRSGKATTVKSIAVQRASKTTGNRQAAQQRASTAAGAAHVAARRSSDSSTNKTAAARRATKTQAQETSVIRRSSTVPFGDFFRLRATAIVDGVPTIPTIAWVEITSYIKGGRRTGTATINEYRTARRSGFTNLKEFLRLRATAITSGVPSLPSIEEVQIVERIVGKRRSAKISANQTDARLRSSKTEMQSIARARRSSKTSAARQATVLRSSHVQGQDSLVGRRSSFVPMGDQLILRATAIVDSVAGLPTTEAIFIYGTSTKQRRSSVTSPKPEYVARRSGSTGETRKSDRTQRSGKIPLATTLFDQRSATSDPLYGGTEQRSGTTEGQAFTDTRRATDVPAQATETNLRAASADPLYTRAESRSGSSAAVNPGSSRRATSTRAASQEGETRRSSKIKSYKHPGKKKSKLNTAKPAAAMKTSGPKSGTLRKTPAKVGAAKTPKTRLVVKKRPK